MARKVPEGVPARPKDKAKLVPEDLPQKEEDLSRATTPALRTRVTSDDSADEEEVAHINPSPSKAQVRLALQKRLKQALKETPAEAESSNDCIGSLYELGSVLDSSQEQDWLRDYGTFGEADSPFYFDIVDVPEWTAPFPFHATLVAQRKR